jgi:drug/metabolite transporter (DMT)-like permease
MPVATQNAMGESAPRPRSSIVAPALIVGVTAISFAAIFFRKAAPTHPMVSAGIRLAVAALLLSPLLFRAMAQGRVTGRLVRAGVLGGLLYGAHFGTWVTSLMLTSVAASVTLVTATPLLLAVAGLITGRDRPTRRLWMALGLALFGVLLIGGAPSHQHPDALTGDALALAGAAAMAGYLVVGRRLGEALDLWPFMAITTAVGSATMFTGAALLGVPLEAASTEALGYLVLAALLPQLVGHGLLTWSLRHTTPTTVGMATVGEPVGAAALGWVWLGESVSPLTAVGCLITLAAVALALRSRPVP